MRSGRAAALLILCACQREAAVYVQIVAEPAVPALEKLHVMVLQNGELLHQEREDFPLTGITLPQTVLVSSHGKTDGPIDVIAQGFVGGTVEARGEIAGTLTRDKPYGTVTLVLVLLCIDGVCGITPTTCDAQSATCGTIDDRAGGFIDCGSCPSGQTCGASGPHHCGTGACTPTASCASMDAGCGYVFDGCEMVSCGGCPATQGCTVEHTCACVPRVTCASVDGGCLPIDDGCGNMITCKTCVQPYVCGGGKDPAACTCPGSFCDQMPCGTADGCGGICQTGVCSEGIQCMNGECTCPAGFGKCADGVCHDLLHDASNCGSCGNKCLDGTCANGMCPCADPSDNFDGHCCPPGFVLEKSWGYGTLYCYSSQPLAAADLGTAEAICANAKACVGFGANVIGSSPIPEDAGCGTYLEGRRGYGSDPLASWVVSYSSPGSSLMSLGDVACAPCDGGLPCTSDCFDNVPRSGCVQQFYCVMDPLGPRSAFCSENFECPGGFVCQAGACVADTSPPCCVSAYACGASHTGVCNPVGQRASGQCSMP